MSQTLHYRGTRAELRQLLAQLIQGMSGHAGELAPYVRGIKLRVGLVALDCIHRAFEVKSQGGTDEAGIKWKDLSKATIAQRPLTPSDKSKGIKQGQRGLLTPEQNKRWKMVFATRKAWLRAKFGMDENSASKRAAEIAWDILKSEGAKTKLDTLGTRKVLIGRDTERLYNSLDPGTEHPEHLTILEDAPDPPGAASDRILREEAGAFVVGSNVSYAEKFGQDRPMWPAGELPEAWNQRIADAGKQGIQDAISLILEGRG